MFCNNCGKEIDNDSQFCEYCGSNIDKSNNKLIIRKKYIITISFIVICVAIIIGFLMYNNSKSNNIQNIVNQDTKTEENVVFTDLSVEENNGYKTFNFTIDDVIKAYLIDENKVILDKNGPFCKEHIGTTRAEFFPDKSVITQYETNLTYITIIYEDISRKVIFINTPITTFQIASILTDNNMTLEDKHSGDILLKNAYNCMLSLLTRVNIQFKDITPINSKYIYLSNGIECGRYEMLCTNIGLVQCLTEYPEELCFIIEATNEDEFYNSTLDILLDRNVNSMYNEVEQKNETIKNNNFEKHTNSESEKINKTYTNREAMIKSEGYGTSYDVYIFNSGTVEHTEDMTTYKGSYTINNNKIVITYTDAYDVDIPIKLDKFDDELTIKDENTLITLDGIEYLKEK